MTKSELIELAEKCGASHPTHGTVVFYPSQLEAFAAALTSSTPAGGGLPELPHNPWREFVENCIDGSNYFRASEYRELIAYIDSLLAASPVPVGEQCGWIDQFGNVFPMGAWRPSKATYLDDHKKAWRPIYTAPPERSDVQGAEPKNQSEWDRVYGLVRHWEGRAREAESALASRPAVQQEQPQSAPKADERGIAEPVPFGYWHQGSTEEESDFFLHSESGEVGCVMCVNLYKHPTPYTAPARDGSEPVARLTDEQCEAAMAELRKDVDMREPNFMVQRMRRAIEAALREKAGGKA